MVTSSNFQLLTLTSPQIACTQNMMLLFLLSAWRYLFLYLLMHSFDLIYLQYHFILVNSSTHLTSNRGINETNFDSLSQVGCLASQKCNKYVCLWWQFTDSCTRKQRVVFQFHCLIQTVSDGGDGIIHVLLSLPKMHFFGSCFDAFP